MVSARRADVEPPARRYGKSGTPVAAECELDARRICFYSFPVANPSKGAGPAPAKPLPFEDALKKLEGVVEAMESGELPLETLLARYEEGTRLVKLCQEKLAEAELKIQQLEKDAGGEMKLKPLETEADER